MPIYPMAVCRQVGAWLRRFDDEAGQGLTEYALILALIAVVAVVALSLVGGDVTTQINNVGSSIPS